VATGSEFNYKSLSADEIFTGAEVTLLSLLNYSVAWHAQHPVLYHQHSCSSEKQWHPVASSSHWLKYTAASQYLQQESLSHTL